MNISALPSGPQQDHFLAVAKPDSVREWKRMDHTMFEPCDYGVGYSTTTSYAPGAAWAFMMHEKRSLGVIAYNDI